MFVAEVMPPEVATVARAMCPTGTGPRTGEIGLDGLPLEDAKQLVDLVTPGKDTAYNAAAIGREERASSK